MIRILAKLWGPLVALALTVSPGVSWAGDPALAEQLFNEGIALMDEGKSEQACEKFAASMEVEPSGGAALNLGRCHEEQGHTATAWASYKRAATLFASTKEEERQRFAQDQVARLEPGLSKLTIEAPKIDGLTITRNGEPVPAAALGSPIPVDPGEQRVEARASGHESAVVTVTLDADGASKTVAIPELARSGGGSVTPAPDADADADAESGVDPLVVSGAVLLGVGGVGLIAGGIVGGIVLGEANDARELCGGDNRCDGGTEPGADGLELADSAKGKATAADVLIVGGSILAAGGAVLLILGLTGDDDGDEAARWQVTPWVGAAEGGMQLQGRF